MSTTSERFRSKQSIDNNQTFENPRRTSADNDSITNMIDKPVPEVTRKMSTESFPMSIDDDKHSDNENNDSSGPFHLVVDESIISSSSKPLQSSSKVDDQSYLTSKEFNYTMRIMDEKMNALYKLCKYIGEQQEQTTKSLKKLVARDELSDQFWSVGSLIVGISSIFILILIIKMIFSLVCL
jgi:hypothetical protein